MKLLDLFCGAGGASMGYHRAGFEVTGIDIIPQPNYPFAFIQADAIVYLREHGHEYDVIHASPPCQLFSTATNRHRRDLYPNLLDDVRSAMPPIVVYVIENVPRAPLIDPITLCGSSFRLDLRRHRCFESNLALESLPCDHKWQTPRFVSLDGKRRKSSLATVVGVHGSTQYKGDFENRCRAMGIDWMTNAELTQAIPPAYTQFIGAQIISLIGSPAGRVAAMA